MASSTVDACGITNDSITGANGIGVNRAPTRSIGASSQSNALYCSTAATSAPKPIRVTASCATTRAVVAHEAVKRMGFGAEVAAVLQYKAFDWLDAPIERVGARFTPIPFAPVMESFVIPHASTVLEAIYRTVNKKT